MLYTKCRVATAPVTGEARTQVLQSCCDTLDLVKKNFSKIGAQARLLHAWYLQVIRTCHILCVLPVKSKFLEKLVLIFLSLLVWRHFFAIVPLIIPWHFCFCPRSIECKHIPWQNLSLIPVQILSRYIFNTYFFHFLLSVIYFLAFLKCKFYFD